MKVSGTRNFRTLSKLSEQSLEVTPLYFTYARQKTHNTLSISVLLDVLTVGQFLVNEPSDKRIFHSSNI